MKKFVSVQEYLSDLSGDKLDQVQRLREMILGCDKVTEERIKWNAPSYVVGGDDRITFGMNKAGLTSLVLHMGASRKESRGGKPVIEQDHGLVEWKSDIRGLITIHDSSELAEKQSDIADVLKRWTEL